MTERRMMPGAAQPKIKICGLSRLEDIDAVNQVLPDLIGLVFAPSKRQVGFEQARELKARLDPRITAVGVFVDAPLERIVRLYEAGVIQMAQLHGHENAALVDALRQRYGIPVIKTVQVRALGVEGVNVAQPTADYLLFDSGAGSGEPFDWSLLAQVRAQLPPAALKTPWFLAGGLDLANLHQALALKPWGVDVSSGVETNGLKDSQKISDFVNAVRSADIPTARPGRRGHHE